MAMLLSGLQKPPGFASNPFYGYGQCGKDLSTSGGQKQRIAYLNKPFST
jgi:hypothetical protein